MSTATGRPSCTSLVNAFTGAFVRGQSGAYLAAFFIGFAFTDGGFLRDGS